MKQKLIVTEKGNLMVVGDLPVLNYYVYHNGLIVMDNTIKGINSKRKAINEGDRFGFYRLSPIGEWECLGKLKSVTNVQAGKVVRLVEANVKLRNRYGKKAPKYDVSKDDNSVYKYLEWQKEEREVFHNPVLFWEPK